MKKLFILWIFFLAGTFYLMSQLMTLEHQIAQESSPPFNYIEFEIPPDLKYSKNLFQSFHDKNLVGKVQESLDVDFWYIPFYVGMTILGWILLLKTFKVDKNWILIAIAVLAILAGGLDYFENKNLEYCLSNWNIESVENAAFYAKIKFAIILPLLLALILGWIFFLGKKIFSKFKKASNN